MYYEFWKKRSSWIQWVNPDVYSAYCRLYWKNLQTDGSVISQVKLHEKFCKSKTTNNNQRIFVAENGQALLEPKGTLFSLSKDLVITAENLRALHFTSSNYSFVSAQSDNECFCAMFLDPQKSITTISWKPKWSIIFSMELHHI